MKKFAITSLALFFTAVCAYQAGAQAGFQEWEGTTRGSGTLDRERDPDARINSVHLTLRRNGEAEVRAYGDSTAVFTGRWRAVGPLEVALELNGGTGIDAGVGSSDFRGRGRVILGRGNAIQSLEIEGSARAQRIHLTFQGPVQPDRPGGVFPPDNSGGTPPGRVDDRHVGIYRSAVTDYRDDYMVVRRLRLKEDGTAELVSRIRGREPRITRNDERRHGSLLSRVVSARRITHAGTWRSNRNRIEVQLDRINGDRVESRLVFEARGDELAAVSWDRNLYGDLGFQFMRTRQETDEDTAADIYLSGNGYGSYEIGRGLRSDINRVSVYSRPNDDVDIILALDRGLTRRFTGRVTENTSRSITIRLTSSGQDNASGTITIEPGPNNTIRRLSGDGLVDRRRFSVNFASERSPNGGGERINLYGRGNGRFFREGRRDDNFRSVSVVSKSDGTVDISMELTNGNRLTLTGRLQSYDAQRYIIRLTNAEQADASGTITINYGANNSINTIFGDGRIDGQRFSINFAR
ncbi:MAG TPA: hypothetical protein VNO70_21405 [Blastocatellia bacterium]|nr:hypothetical protein [Blastocatellia bacterium]